MPLPFAHERLVDLDHVEQEALQIGERGVAGAEAVERQSRAEITDALQHLRGVLGVLHDQRLRKLELERPARQSGARDHRAQIVDEILSQQLPRRHVDGGEQDRAGAVRAAKC